MPANHEEIAMMQKREGLFLILRFSFFLIIRNIQVKNFPSILKMAATVDERGNFYADQEVIVLAPS